MLVKNSRPLVKNHGAGWNIHAGVGGIFMSGWKIHDLGEKPLASLQQYPTVGGGEWGASHSVGARKGVTLGKNDTLQKSLHLSERKIY
jgi:hypothetical protein